MSVFLLLYGTIYGTMHVLFARQCISAFTLDRSGTLAIGLFCLAMMGSPFAARVAEQSGWEVVGLWLPRFGFTWMGLLFCFLVGTGTAEIAGQVWRRMGRVPGFLAQDSSWPRIRLGIGVLWVMVVVVCGIIEANDIHLVEQAVQVNKSLEGKKELRIIQISDVHLGPHSWKGRIERIVEMVMASNPDLVVASGDLIDGRIPDLPDIQNLFGRIRAPLGKYLVLGNHEWYSGVPAVESFAKATGFELLRNERREIASGIILAGVDDPAGCQMGLCALPDEAEVLPERGSNKLVLFLKHRPEVIPSSEGRFDLQFSGHTHQGQIAPFGWILGLINRWPAGLSEVGKGTWIYHSRGTGTWGPPFRFFAPPEITCIRIRGTENPEGPQ